MAAREDRAEHDEIFETGSTRALEVSETAGLKTCAAWTVDVAVTLVTAKGPYLV